MESEPSHTLDYTEGIQPLLPGAIRWPEPCLYRDAQVWKDIEAETGFASYEDYVVYYSHVRPDLYKKFWELLYNDPTFEDYRSARNETVIYDLSIQQNSSTRLNQRCCCESGTELIQALRKPPNGVCVQLVLWLRPNSPLNLEMVDTLGLGLRLDLDDFDYYRRWSPPPRKSGLQIKSIFGEQTVAAISQGFMHDIANEVPVVLVASAIGGYYWDLLELSSIAGYWKPPPFCKSPRVLMPVEAELGDDASKREVGVDDSLERVSLKYAWAVQNFIVQDRDVQPTKQSLLLASISPLLIAEVCRMTKSINEVQAMYTDLVFKVREPRVSHEDLDQHRLELRRITEVNEDILGQFSRYLGSEGQSDLIDQPSYASIVANLRSLIADARRLDTEVRDFKQIQVGDLALKESQKSIELSTAQIREAKSGKFPNDSA